MRHSIHWVWAACCVAVVLLGNLVGARFVSESREEALRATALEMRLDLVERAASLEATLRAGRSGLQFLASSAALADLPAALADEDPALARFRRLGAEGDLLHYLEAHPEMERLVVRDGQGVAVLAVGRRASFPVPIPLEATERESSPGRLRFVAPLGDGRGHVAADVNPASLLSSLSTGTGRAVLLDASGAPLAGTPDAYERLLDRKRDRAGDGADAPDRRRRVDASVDARWVDASVEVAPADFEPEVRWRLERAERVDALLGSVGALASRYHAMLLLNGLAVIATVVLSVLLLRTARRRARLEERAAQATQLREIEAHLHEADRLASVGRLAATLAHEVRNPLEGMGNWLALAESEARSAGAASVLPYTGRVKQGIEHLAEVVRRVLALAKPSASQLGPVDLGDIVRAGIESVEGMRSFRGVEIVTQLAERLPRVQADSVLLGQLLLNLLLNARDAGGETMTIRIETSVAGREVRLAVRDTGPGFPPERLADPAAAFASGKGSTGLGLSLCDRIARVHGGQLGLSNHPQGGAVVTLSLPVPGTEDPAPEGAAGAAAETRA